MNDLSQARLAAQQVLAYYESLSPTPADLLAATPIDALVAWQGIVVERFNPVDYPAGTLGWLEPGEDLVWLSMALDEPVRRFTLAHELGHWVLHRQGEGTASGALRAALGLAAGSNPAACTEQDVEAYLAGGALEDELLGPGQSYSPRARRERAADAFAAELLAPLERVRALWLGAATRPPLAPEQLAAHFGITLKALLGRLVELLQERPGAQAEKTGEPAARPASPGAAKPYDPYQQVAIAAPTPALVVAGPGSGKTSTLVGRVRHLIFERGIPPRRILALTFSNKAAREMRDRIASLLGEEMVLPTVSTFHSFCAEVLRLYAAQVGLRPDFALLDTPDSYFLLRRVASHLPLQHYAHLSNPEMHFATLLGAISRAKDELATPEDYLRLAEAALAAAQTDEARLAAEKAREVALVYQTYQAALTAQGDADFGDLILLAVRFLQEHPAALAELRERYQQILVDEFQDINRASGVLLKLLAGERAAIWVVGDQDQAIYRFRGASPANIGQFHRDYAGAQVLPLSRNYRSLPDIVSSAGVFREAVLHPGQETAPGGQSGLSLRQEAVRPQPTEPLVTLATAPDEQHEIAGLIAEIEARHRAGTLYRDQIILCRTRQHARDITEGLARAGVPVGAGGGLLEQPEVKDWLAIVALLAEPSGMGLLRAGLQPEHLIPSADLLALFEHARRQEIPAGLLLWQSERLPPLSPTGFAGMMRLADILADLRLAPDIWTLLARYVFIHTGQARQLLASTDRPSRLRLEHLRGLLDLARRFETQERERLAAHQAGGAPDAVRPQLDEGQPEGEQEGQQWERFLEYLRVLMELRADGASRREADESEQEAEDVVRVMTVHASKGLEFPVVYLPQLANNRFPFARRGEAAPPPPGLCEDEAARSREDARAAHLLDEACLFYVGLTRARDHLILSRAERYKARRYAPSDFLSHIETALGSRLRRVRWEGAPLARAPAGEDSQATAPALPGGAPTLSAGELETYLRCPRQYKYRYLYAFQPTEKGYRQFYACVQQTLRAVHDRFAAFRASPGLAAPNETGDQVAVVPAPEPALSLAEVHLLFAEQWRQQGPLDHPFAETYFQHGLRVVEQVWGDLSGVARGASAQPAPAETPAAEPATPPDPAPAEQPPPAIRLEAGSRLSQKLHAQLAEQAVQVTVDRIEDETPGPAGDPKRPVRLVRHRLGGKDEEALQVEARHILYALAQEQRTPGRPVEVYEHNLTTGALAQVPLQSKAAQNRRAELEAALVGLRARRYPPKPDRYFCPRCPFVLICPAE